jgi:hypothetical protein
VSAQRPLRLRIESTAPLDPLLLRAAIAARLDGRTFPGRGEDEVGRRVTEAVQQHLRRGRP